MAKAKAEIGIVMGSDSDWSIVKSATETLDSFGIGYEVRVISAHRTPELAAEYASTAEKRGLKVILSAAGGAAHLGGVLAAATILPVIGIPIKGGLMCQITDHHATQAATHGLIALQMHPGPPMKVQFKNIRIKHLLPLK